ncbi:hypothetical protein [uncultured Thiodictyon sp.]|uniref:hypothetical protein n=1 Tax=uncultured Thiodictyon sp. TaxID=1846217 RepID=UPI0025DBBE70|nr:hypothetical protein [uncultured Thiodictyon sp.]
MVGEKKCDEEVSLGYQSFVVVAAMLAIACWPQNDTEAAGGAGSTGTENSPAESTRWGATAEQGAVDPMNAASGAAPKMQSLTGKGLPPGVMRFERAVIVDAGGFEQPLAASTLFIPHGWVTQGGVRWGSEFICTNGYNIDWSAASPDGLTTIAIFPQEKWELNNYGAGPSTPGCASAPYTTTKDYLQSVAQRRRPDARILDYRRRPDIEQPLANFNTETPMPLGTSRTWVEAGEILFAYNERGRDMRGSVAAAVVFSLMQTDAGMGVMSALTAMALPAYGVTAPDGQLNLGFFEAIRRTIQTNPLWEQRIAGHNTAINRVALEESGKRADSIARSNAEISRIREDAWNSYQKSADRRAREFGELMRGIETYRDTDAPGGTVELSHNYGHAWRLNDGSYVLTNAADFEPWRDLGLEGRKLETSE